MRLPPAALLACTLLAACSSIRPAEIHDPGGLQGIHRAYVVKHDNSKAGMDLAVQRAIAEHGIATRTGSMRSKPRGTDVYVTYVDRWSWDVAMYLKSLTVSVFDNRTDRLIATGSFKNSPFFHSFPDADEKAAEVVDSIFAAARSSPAAVEP